MLIPRRTAILAGASLAGCLNLPRPATAGGPKVLRLAYLLSRQSQLGAGAEAMAKHLESHSAGRIRIQQFPDAALGGELEVLKAVQLGAVDLVITTASPLGTILPDIGIFSIPFLFTDVAHARAVMDGPIGTEYAEMLAAKNLVALAWGENGLRHLTNSRHPISTPADLKNLKLRLPQSPVMLLGFRALGADANPLPFPRLYEALQAGTFDGQENPIATIISARLNQVQKYLTLSGHVYDPALIVMSPDAHDDLSAADQALLKQAAQAGAAASRDFASAAQSNGIATLQQAGMQIVPEIDRAQFASAMAAANPGFEKLFSAKHLADIRTAA